MKVTGKIKSIGDVQSGTTKDAKEWKKLVFTITTDEEYNNLYAFEIFGADKVDKFIQYNSVGKDVDVDFNISTNEWKGKYFTTLQAWKVFKVEGNEAPAPVEVDSPPF